MIESNDTVGGHGGKPAPDDVETTTRSEPVTRYSVLMATVGRVKRFPPTSHSHTLRGSHRPNRSRRPNRHPNGDY